MADWYTKTVLTIIAVCLLFLAGREAMAPSRNTELAKIVKGLDDIDGSLSLIYNKDLVQKVAICDVRHIADDNCVLPERFDLSSSSVQPRGGRGGTISAQVLTLTDSR